MGQKSLHESNSLPQRSRFLSSANMKIFRIIVFAIFATTTASLSAADNEQRQPWAQMLEVVGYAETAKASLARACLPGNLISRTSAYTALCSKLSFIPNNVINDAALPFARKHVSGSEARDAIAYYSHPRAQRLREKSNRELRTGRNDQLSPAELKEVMEVDNQPFARALSDFAGDPECNRAVARAIISF
ncbi:hypothetical protein [Paracidovorax citrulli]|uniref:hypothetical protein n=1 Tax=Paracidovorax citrulli TaxID=80869 RepID=UPI001269FDAC|nr:hypothetical protein [Paracidovorax citrulli]